MMRITIWLLAAACGCAFVGDSRAQDLPRQHHPWGRFHTDSWKQVRVVNETLSPDGTVMLRGVTETKTTLISADATGYTLKIDVVVEIDGKRFASPPQIVWHGYFGQRQGQTVEVRKAEPGKVLLAGREMPCEQRTVVVTDGRQSRTTLVSYSPEVSPFTLRKEVVHDDDRKVVSEVVAFDREEEVLGVQRPTARLRTVTTQGKNSLATVEVMCDDVPGGVVTHSSQETDEQGRVVRRSTLELLAYESVECPQGEAPPRRRLFHRREARREARRD